MDIEYFIQNELEYWRNFKTELWLVTKKFEDTSLIQRQIDRIDGKIELLERIMEMLKEEKENEEQDE